jgi:hypothetical protein
VARGQPRNRQVAELEQLRDRRLAVLGHQQVAELRQPQALQDAERQPPRALPPVVGQPPVLPALVQPAVEAARVHVHLEQHPPRPISPAHPPDRHDSIPPLPTL